MAPAGSLLDARAAERFRGEVEPVDPVAGHIPGAVSAPTREQQSTPTAVPAAGGAPARFAALGATEDRPVAAYCGSGVDRRPRGPRPGPGRLPAALYAGSWSDWITDPDRPVATGP